MMEILLKLEEDVLIRPSPDLEDRRKINWSLTSHGRKILERSNRTLRKLGKEMDDFFKSQGITPMEIERFKEILTLIKLDFLEK